MASQLIPSPVYILPAAERFPEADTGTASWIYQSTETNRESVYVYLRQHQNQRVVVALAFSDHTQTRSVPLEPKDYAVLVSTHMDREGPEHDLSFRSDERIILKVNPIL